MPALASQSRRHGGAESRGHDGHRASRGGGHDSGAYYDSDAPPPPASRGGARPSSRHHSTAAYFPDGSGHNRQPHGAYDDDAGAANGAGQGGPQVQMPGPDLASGGAGGLSGVRDPYDKPTRNQLAGAQSRLRQDKRSGALMEVRGSGWGGAGSVLILSQCYVHAQPSALAPSLTPLALEPATSHNTA